MKILFTGGGTGGHFYPIIAVAEELNNLAKEQKLLDAQLFFASPDPYDKDMLMAENIIFVQTSAGKMRRYFSVLNIVDLFRTVWGVLKSIFRIFFLYPDVVFAKGGYASFPTLVASRIFNIPVVIHESDAVPGKVNRWAGKFAKRIAISFPEAARYFPADKVAYTGQPIRKAALYPLSEGAREFLKLDPSLPVILVLGGSQGALALNEVILDALPQLTKEFQIVHQTGAAHIQDMESRANIILTDSVLRGHYKAFPYLNDLATRMSAGVASIVVSRAGSTIFEIAAWGLPSIIIPLPNAAGDHQTINAYSYARAEACSVIEQNNLSASLLTSEIHRILNHPPILGQMATAAKKFSKKDAARIIASALIDIALTHES